MDETRYHRLAPEKAAQVAAVAKATREEEQRRQRHAKLQRRLARNSRREKAWIDWLTNDCNDTP